MVAKIASSTLTGIDAEPVDVEVRTHENGEHYRFTVVGMADTAVRESRERVDAALRFSGFHVPKNILVNLAPAEVKKEGASFDLPMALGILIASGQLRNAEVEGFSIHGELSLDGQVKAIRGVVALAIQAREQGASTIFVPAENGAEAALIKGIDVIGVGSLVELVAIVTGSAAATPYAPAVQRTRKESPHLAEVWGQTLAKRALMIAAAGGHNILMLGPPGCGKSMLAERFPSILPRLSQRDILETIRVHSVAGLPISDLISGVRPFRGPHHGISDAGLVGGGTVPRPGEISLAHNGVLFLDEFPEFKRSALESLRAPLESGKVQITRAKASLNFPARFQLIAAMNPCPCGRLGVKGLLCRCSKTMIDRYLQRLSQPILDRIDLQVEMDAVPLSVIGSATSGQGNDQDIREQVEVARDRAIRERGLPNSQLPGTRLREVIRATPSALKLLEVAEKKTALSARGLVRVLRVARTIADLENSAEVVDAHVAEAIGFRSLDRIQRLCAAA